MHLSELINRLLEIQSIINKDIDPIVALEVYDKNSWNPQVLKDDEIFVGKYILIQGYAVIPKTEEECVKLAQTFVILG